MARNVADLVKEMQVLGIPVTPAMTSGRGDKRAMMDALAAHKNVGVDLLPQIEVMLCRDAKEYINIEDPNPYETTEMNMTFWNNPGWVAEEKLDGNRMKAHFGVTGVRFDSRRRSDDTYTFSEKTGNFPHIEMWPGFPQYLADTILDGEVLCPKAVVNTGSVTTHSTQQSTSAIANSGPEKAIAIQRDNDAWIEYHAFDIIRYKGESTIDWPYYKRRAVLQEVIDQLNSNNSFWHITRVAVEKKLEFFKDIIDNGGEGVILKSYTGKYEPDKRSKTHYKLKRFTTQDGFIVGWIPGEGANSGLVGAVEVACYIGGKIHKFASVSQFTHVERVEMTDIDGSLKEEYYNRVVEVRGQILTKNGRYQHAVFLGWRPDKSALDCDGYEMRQELLDLGVLI